MGHATVEWVYVGVVVSLLTYVGAESWNIERLIEHAPVEAENIKVTGQQWFWTFEHEDGRQEVGELHVTRGVPYKFELVSMDVIHDFNIPDFTVLLDVVPGRVNTIWNLFDKSGEYLIQCREYCGLLHYNMKAKLFVEEPSAETTEASTAQAASTVGDSAEGGAMVQVLMQLHPQRLQQPQQPQLLRFPMVHQYKEILPMILVNLQ